MVRRHKSSRMVRLNCTNDKTPQVVNCARNYWMYILSKIFAKRLLRFILKTNHFRTSQPENLTSQIKSIISKRNLAGTFTTRRRARYIADRCWRKWTSRILNITWMRYQGLFTHVQYKSWASQAKEKTLNRQERVHSSRTNELKL